MKFYVAITISVLGLAAMLGSEALQVPSIYGKMLASTAFVAAGVLAGGLRTPYGRAILVALFFSWWGDLFLALKGTFLYGLVAFLLGHIFFAVAFLVHGVRWAWAGAAAAALVPVVIAVTIWLGDTPAELLYPVYAYMAVISAMVALSFGARGAGASWWLVAGAVLFYCSDLFVARQRFVAPGAINGIIGLPLYFGAQWVFAYTCKLVGPGNATARAAGEQ